jgi:hypothetical protein
MVDVNAAANVFARDNLERTANGSMTPLIPARVRFRIRTICHEAAAETFVPADISRD